MASVASELVERVELSETETFDLEHSSGSAAVLAKSQRRILFEALSDEFPEGTESFYELSRLWKDDSYVDDSQTLEHIYDEAFGVKAPVRNGSLDGRLPRDGEPGVAKTLKTFSEAYLTKYHGETARLYRGIGTHDGLCEAVTELLDAGESGTELDLTVLSNFTSDRGTADEYGKVVVEVGIDSEQVALAADFFLPVETEDGLADHEAEIRVFGSPEICVSESSLLISGSQRSLIAAIKNPDANGGDHHDIVAGVVEILANNSVVLSLDASKKLIDWYEVYFERERFDALALREGITAILHDDADAP